MARGTTLNYRRLSNRDASASCARIERLRERLQAMALAAPAQGGVRRLVAPGFHLFPALFSTPVWSTTHPVIATSIVDQCRPPGAGCQSRRPAGIDPAKR